MTDDPFADLGETLDDSADDPAPDSPSDDGGDGPADSAGSPSSGVDPTTDSAFSYDEAQQRPFYARPETIDDFDSWLNYELERELSTRGYQNIVVREMTDALLRTVVEEDLLEETAERFERAREESHSDA